MKKLFTTTLFIILSFAFCKAQYVTVPDANFATWLQANYPNCMNGNQMDTTCSDITSATYVDCQYQNISNLSGIEYFDNLQTLGCGHNLLTSLPRLPATLTSLVCQYNNLTSLPELPPNLSVLTCYNNKLTNLPVIPATVEYIYCYDNQLTSIPTLPPALYDFECEWNQLTSLPALPNTLAIFDCSTNQLTSLPILPGRLSMFYCNDNKLTSLPVLTATEIEELNCSNNQLTSLPELPAYLSSLICSGNQLINLPLLPVLLKYLGCANNQLTNLPAIAYPYTQLISLDCSVNQITNLPELPDSLSEFNVSGNPNLNCVPPLKKFLSNGVYFKLSGTGITCLPNVIQHNGSIPAIDTMPICGIFNAHGCDAAWNIKGKVFKDNNNNCIQDTGDQKIFNNKIELYQSGILIQSGYFYNDYSFKTSLSTYTVKLDTSNFPFIVSCPASGDTTINVTSLDSIHYPVDFGLSCKPWFDVGAWSMYKGHSNFFPGRLTSLYLLAGDVVKGMYNVYCTSGISGHVKVVINGSANYSASLFGALTPTVKGDTLIYDISDFSKINPDSAFAFQVLTDTSAQIGDQICFDVYVTPTSGDNNQSNNFLEHCFKVSNSYDPNEKEVSPTGNLPFGYNDWLTYTIHFQNTGTAAARHIQVLDTLDTGLGPETFQLLSYSFAPIVQIAGRNVAFDFVNINLPDSSTNKTGSTGYVEYRIKPYNNLAGGTTISNRASIYFDFNSPIGTNTTTNTIELATGIKNIKPVSVSIYPNPTESKLMINCSQLMGCEIEVSDLLGRHIFSQTARSNETTLDVNSLAPGVYFLHIRSAGVDEVRKFVKE